MNDLKVLIIIPAYNEEANIRNVIKQVKSINIPVDYVVINDCSTDSTKQVLKEYGINHIDLPVNLGIGGAVQTGYVYARDFGYDVAIQLDGDGQHNPCYIESMVAELQEKNADVIIGSRFIDNQGFQSTIMRRIGIKFLSGLIKFASNQRILDVTSGYRAANRKGIDLYAKEYAQDYPEPEAIITGAKAGLTIKETPVIMSEREFGSSSISGFSSMYYMIKVSLAILICSLRKGK